MTPSPNSHHPNLRVSKTNVLLLKHGAYVPPNVTPPILAIHRGDSGQLGELIDRDPGLLAQRFPDMPYGNILLRGAGLLHCAVEFGENECIEELLRRGANINLRADIIGGIGGQTPIFHAIATNLFAGLPTLEYLARRAGPAIDMTVRATCLKNIASERSSSEVNKVGRLTSPWRFQSHLRPPGRQHCLWAGLRHRVLRGR